MLSEEDRRRTAYHEAGHAIVGMLTPGADPVRKVSIIPRGQSLGVTFSAPDADRFNFDERYLLAQIKVALGGRAAEELVFGDMTTGRRVRHPAPDPDRAPDGRSLGHERGDRARSRCCLPDGAGPLLPGVQETSESTQRLVDEEVRRIVESAHAEVGRAPARAPLATSTRWSPGCSSTRRSTRPTPTRRPGCPATPRHARNRRCPSSRSSPAVHAPPAGGACAHPGGRACAAPSPFQSPSRVIRASASWHGRRAA